MAGSAAVLGVVLLLLVSGSHHKSTGHQVAVADVPKGTGPGSSMPSPSGSPTDSPSPSASASASAKPKAGTGHGSTSTQHSPSKSAHSGRAPGPAAARLFGGASYVLLHNAATGLCADLPNLGKGSADGPVDEYTCRSGDGDNQMWSLQKLHRKGPGRVNLFVVRNTKDGLCMDLPDFGGKPAGTRVSEYRCDGSPRDNQSWYIWPGHGNHYQLRNAKSGGRCLGVAGGPGAGPDARLALRPCGPADTNWSW